MSSDKMEKLIENFSKLNVEDITKIKLKQLLENCCSNKIHTDIGTSMKSSTQQILSNFF